MSFQGLYYSFLRLLGALRALSKEPLWQTMTHFCEKCTDSVPFSFPEKCASGREEVSARLPVLSSQKKEKKGQGGF